MVTHGVVKAEHGRTCFASGLPSGHSRFRGRSGRVPRWGRPASHREFLRRTGTDHPPSAVVHGGCLSEQSARSWTLTLSSYSSSCMWNRPHPPPEGTPSGSCRSRRLFSVDPGTGMVSGLCLH